jgi:hypothetical protein
MPTFDETQDRNYDTASHGTEELRYFDPARCCLVSVLREGLVLYMGAEDANWRLARRKKPEIDTEQWLASRRRRTAGLPSWAQDVQILPSFEELEFWMCDGVAETITGDQVEPDGNGPDGAPSWLLALGLL